MWKPIKMILMWKVHQGYLNVENPSRLSLVEVHKDYLTWEKFAKTIVVRAFHRNYLLNMNAHYVRL